MNAEPEVLKFSKREAVLSLAVPAVIAIAYIILVSFLIFQFRYTNFLGIFLLFPALIIINNAKSFYFALLYEVYYGRYNLVSFNDQLITILNGRYFQATIKEIAPIEESCGLFNAKMLTFISGSGRIVQIPSHWFEDYEAAR